MRTFTPKPADIHRAWHVIDAEGKVLGRVATEAATLLRGKHKPIFAHHVDTGDHVIIVRPVIAGSLPGNQIGAQHLDVQLNPGRHVNCRPG